MRRTLIGLGITLAMFAGLLLVTPAEARPSDDSVPIARCTLGERGLIGRGVFPVIPNEIKQTGGSAGSFQAPSLGVLMNVSTTWHQDGAVADETVWPLNTSAGTRYFEWHVRQAVFHQSEGCEDYPDNWAYWTYMSCSRRRPDGVGGEVFTPCNFRTQDSALAFKGCYITESCTWQRPWGERGFSATNRNTVTFIGTSHSFPSFDASLRSSNDYMQVDLLDPWTGARVGQSAWWTGCSATVGVASSGILVNEDNGCAGFKPR